MADPAHRYLLHDHDTIFSAEVDEALNGFGLKVLKTPVRSPMANAYCERVIGTIRRECLDYLIPMNDRHVSVSSQLTNNAQLFRRHKTDDKDGWW
jgi:putative transposase